MALKNALIMQNDNGTTTTAIQIDTAITSNNVPVVINASGNVGIGTSSPISLLDLAQITASSSLTLRRTLVPTGSGLFQGQVQFGCVSTGSTTVVSSAIRGQSDAAWTSSSAPGTLNFFTTASGSTTLTERLRITSSGNVGIGTSSPALKLHVFNGSSGVTSFNASADETVFERNGNVGITFASPNTNSANIAFADPQSANAGLISYSHSANAMAFFTNAAERARIDASGNLLVGRTAISGDVTTRGAFIRADGKTVLTTTDGQQPLVLAKNNSTGVLLEFFFNGSPRGSVSTNGTTVAYNTSSDYRLKTLVGNVTDSGTRIDLLNPVEFDWIANGQRDRGFFADQFQEVYPNSVTGQKDEVDKDGNPVYQSMQASSSEVIADLVAEIKSLRIRVAQLEGT